MKRLKKYQTGGLPEKRGQAYYDARDKRIRESLTSGLDRLSTGFEDALRKNYTGTIDPMINKVSDALDQENYLEAAGRAAVTMPTAWWGMMPQLAGYGGAETAKYLINNMKPGMTPAERREFNKNFRPHQQTMYKKGGKKLYKKGGVVKKSNNQKPEIKDNWLEPNCCPEI